MHRMLVQLEVAILFAIHHTAADAEFRVFRKALEACLEIPCFEDHITIEFADELPVFTFEPLIPEMKCLHYSGPGQSTAPIWPMECNNPRELYRILIDDLSRIVV